MAIKRCFVILLIVFCAAGERRAFADTLCTDPVPTNSGQVRGADAGNGSCVWKGIPYAAAPVGDLRWKAPQPEPSWTGVREAVKWGDRCMQKGIMSLDGYATDAGMSEDCLYLNIWSPQKSGSFPVMFWIHGGGFDGGNGATPWYWGDRLAADGDVVVVTINYRLNIFGFFADPALRAKDPHQSTGNYGALDMISALQWVKDNIKNFRGDPGNVTIFGESAGGWAVCTLLATPLAQGLFHKAVIESGGCSSDESLDPAYQKAKTVTEKLGCSPSDVKCLRGLPAKKLLKEGVGKMGDFGPAPDGYLMTGTPLSLIQAGNYNKVPILAGYNKDEMGAVLKLNGAVAKTKPEDYEKNMQATWKLTPEEAGQLAKMYPLAEFDNQPVLAYGRIFGTDMVMGCPEFSGLMAAAKYQRDLYFYRFAYDNERAGKYVGTVHALEIPFVFNNLDRLPASLLFNDKNIEEATDLSRIVEGYWLNFARTGNPNGQGRPNWPQISATSEMIQVINTGISSEPAKLADKCAFWEEYTKTKKLPSPFGEKE